VTAVNHACPDSATSVLTNSSRSSVDQRQSHLLWEFPQTSQHRHPPRRRWSSDLDQHRLPLRSSHYRYRHLDPPQLDVLQWPCTGFRDEGRSAEFHFRLADSSDSDSRILQTMKPHVLRGPRHKVVDSHRAGRVGSHPLPHHQTDDDSPSDDVAAASWTVTGAWSAYACWQPSSQRHLYNATQYSFDANVVRLLRRLQHKLV